MAANWKRTRLETVREYDLTPGSIPDLRDSSNPRRMVIRPRKVLLHQQYGTLLVSVGCIEGKMVRRDGKVADRSGTQQILVSHTDRHDGDPPLWLTDLLTAEGLQWATDRQPAAA